MANQSEIEVETSEFEDDDSQIYVDEGAPEAKPPTKRARSRSTLVPRLGSGPFHILKKVENKFMWIADSASKKQPTLGSIRDEYGPGQYEIRDADGNKQRWSIGEDPHAKAAASNHPDPTAPPRLSPQPGYAPHYAPQNPHGAPQAFNQYQRPAPAPVDPQLMGTFYRMDAAIQQLSTDLRRLQDENRSLTYELQQVPARVAERVSATIREASDPFDQMGRVWEMSQKLADGIGPNEDKGFDMNSVLGALAGALSQGALPGGAPPQMMAPPGGTPVAPAQLGAVAPTATDTPVEEPTLPGMTDEIKSELLEHAKTRGLDYAASIRYAQSKGWDAAMLLTVARATAKNNPKPAPNGTAS